MKETIRKNIVNLPYSLHDARVNNIKIISKKIQMYFDKGYFKLMNNDCLAVNGYIEINGVDFDYCSVYIIDSAISCGKFTGEKLNLEQFINNFTDIDFEIIDETYGYNQSKITGYLYEGNEIKECNIEIYHLGNMKYVAEE